MEMFCSKHTWLFVTMYGLVYSSSVNFSHNMTLVHLKIPYFRALTLSSNVHIIMF